MYLPLFPKCPMEKNQKWEKGSLSRERRMENIVQIQVGIQRIPGEPLFNPVFPSPSGAENGAGFRQNYIKMDGDFIGVGKRQIGVLPANVIVMF